MGAAAWIRHHIDKLPPDTIFYNREFLNYGTRNSVDLTLSRLEFSGDIKRLARGVYVRSDCSITYTALDIAKAKAQSFKRKIAAYGVNLARKYGLFDSDQIDNSSPYQNAHQYSQLTKNVDHHVHQNDSKNDLTPMTFHSQGRRTHFKLNNGERIIFHATAARRLDLADLKTGPAVNALWALTKEIAEEKHVRSLLQKFNREEKEEFLWAHPTMTGWLSDLVHKARGGLIRPPRRPPEPHPDKN